MVRGPDGKKLTGAAAKQYKDARRAAEGLPPRKKTLKDTHTQFMVGRSLSMMKSAKEWAVGEIFIVRGASSECWKVEGKGGSSHFAVIKCDESKTCH